MCPGAVLGYKMQRCLGVIIEQLLHLTSPPIFTIHLLPAFDPSRTASSSLRFGCDEQGSGLGPVSSGEHAALSMGAGGSGSNHDGGGGESLGVAESGCC